jgi:hypothetical protein
MGNMQFSDFDKEVLKKIEDLDKNAREKLKKVADEWNLTMTKLQSETEMTSIEKLENGYKKLSELLDKNIEINNEWTNLKEKISKNKDIGDTQKYIFHETILKMQGFILLEIYKCSSDYNRIGNYISEKKRESLEMKIAEQKKELSIFEKNLKIQSDKLDENEKTIQEQNKKLEDNTDKINNHDKRILEMMGIFLSIFSIIGLGTSSILNIENNHFAIWSMICGVILITMSGLFYMINYKDESTMNKRMILPVIIGILLFCIGTVAIIKYPTENKTAKDLETRLKIVEEKIDYEKRINELENKTK